MLPLVKVQSVEIVLEDQFTGFDISAVDRRNGQAIFQSPRRFFRTCNPDSMNYKKKTTETQLSDSPKAAPTTTAKTKKKRMISRCCGEQLVDLPRWLCVYIVGGWIKKCALSEGRSEFEIRSLTFIVDLCDRHMWNMSISWLILSHCWLTNKVSSISARVTWQVNGQPFYDVICRLLMRL